MPETLTLDDLLTAAQPGQASTLTSVTSLQPS